MVLNIIMAVNITMMVMIQKNVRVKTVVNTGFVMITPGVITSGNFKYFNILSNIPMESEPC